MTYNSIEESVFSGDLIELYKFSIGHLTFAYTSSTDELQYLGTSYKTWNLDRNAITQGDDINRGDLLISVSRDFPIADRFRVTPPSTPVLLTVYRVHRGSSDGAVAWQGRVMSVEWKGSVAELRCQSAFSTIQRTGIRRTYQATCPHVLYGVDCRADSVNYAAIGTPTAFTSTTITANVFSSFGDGFYDGGYIEYLTHESITEQRTIVSQVGALATLSAKLVDLDASTQFTVYAGCNRTIDICDSRFSNSVNYGGFPFVPNQTPFGGTTVY